MGITYNQCFCDECETFPDYIATKGIRDEDGNVSRVKVWDTKGHKWEVDDSSFDWDLMINTSVFYYSHKNKHYHLCTLKDWNTASNPAEPVEEESPEVEEPLGGPRPDNQSQVLRGRFTYHYDTETGRIERTPIPDDTGAVPSNTTVPNFNTDAFYEYVRGYSFLNEETVMRGMERAGLPRDALVSTTRNIEDNTITFIHQFGSEMRHTTIRLEDIVP